MGKIKDLTSDEKQQIVALLSANKKTIQIAKQLKIDHRTVKNFTKNCNKQRLRADNGTFRSIDKKSKDHSPETPCKVAKLCLRIQKSPLIQEQHAVDF